MIPVMQTSLTDPATGHGGNCLAACLASVLECSIDDVPDVTGPEYGKDSPTRGHWYSVIQKWLRDEHSCVMWDLGITVSEYGYAVPLIYPGVFYLGSGPSTRGAWHHGVVMEYGRVVHDPHPDQDFTTDQVTEITILVKVPR